MPIRPWNRREFSRLAAGLGLGTCATGRSPAGTLAVDRRFEGRISREVLESYLARAITMQDLFAGRGDLAEDLRMLSNLGAKFLGRTLGFRGEESRLAGRLEKARPLIARAHADDPERIVQACVPEVVSREVEAVPVPARAFQALGLPAETRNFRFQDMAFPYGCFRDPWGEGTLLPDVSRTETQLWFHHLAASYIDIGVEALHYGQVELTGQNDPGSTHLAAIFERARAHAARRGRRKLVLCDAEVPSGGLVRDGKLLLDFHSCPLRARPVPKKGPKARELTVGFADSLYGRSRGGTTVSGWSCDHLPYLVELDDWHPSDHLGQPGVPGAHLCWGDDEVGWFAALPVEVRRAWLAYCPRWIRHHDPAGHFQMPGSRALRSPVQGRSWYRANAPTPGAPGGFGDEAAIRAIWAAKA